MWRNGSPYGLLEGMSISAVIMENWRILKKLKLELPYNPEVPLLGVYAKETKSLSWKYICTPVFNAALFPIPKTWKQEIIRRFFLLLIWPVYHWILFSNKKKKNPKVCHNMDGPWGHYTKTNTNTAWSHMWNLKKKKKKGHKNETETIDTEKRLMVARGSGWNIWRRPKAASFWL